MANIRLLCRSIRGHIIGPNVLVGTNFTSLFLPNASVVLPGVGHLQARHELGGVSIALLKAMLKDGQGVYGRPGGVIKPQWRYHEHELPAVQLLAGLRQFLKVGGVDEPQAHAHDADPMYGQADLGIFTG